eukprot:6410938-Heterocapsa_arctica.AAC.1
MKTCRQAGARGSRRTLCERCQSSTPRLAADLDHFQSGNVRAHPRCGRTRGAGARPRHARDLDHTETW